VSAASATIGDARSSYRDGVISVVNETARARGARPGLRAHDVIDMWARDSVLGPHNALDARGRGTGRRSRQRMAPAK
jgi:hypothetical protein